MLSPTPTLEVAPKPAFALNDAQSRAARHDHGPTSPPLLIVAGAGTGKTATLAHRVAHLVLSGISPQRILLMTFSRRAAAELCARSERTLRTTRPQLGEGLLLPWSGTFHSIAARILREFAPRVGLAPDFSIHDRGDSEDLMGLARAAQRAGSSTQKRFPSAATCMAVYSRTVNAETALPEVLARDFPWCAPWERELVALFDAYVAAKQAQHVLDFDDLLLYWAAMMEDETIAAELGARFDHVLVDEYQDTNRLQGTVLRRLKPDGRGVTVVGDDAQAIYGFRAATVRNILDFPGQYAEPARVVALECNYRSTAPILDASNALMEAAHERHAKTLVSAREGGERPRLVTVADETTEARCVAEAVLAQREDGIDLSQQAVLFRSSHHSAMLELELARCDIPYVKFGGLRFLDCAHVKDTLALLRFAANPRDRLAGYRALRLVPGIGHATATRWLDALDATPDFDWALGELAAPAAGQEAWGGLHTLLQALRAGSLGWPAEVAAAVDWYRPQLERLHDDAVLRAQDLEVLQRIAATYAGRERFLTELTLDPPSATSEVTAPHLDDEFLTLSTIHSAKGREWRSVQVLKCVDGCLPSDMAAGRAEDLEEERRILYVAMTRARDHLALMLPQRFFTRGQAEGGDRHVYAQRSRFITRAVAAHFDEATWPAPVAAPRAAEPPPRLLVDIGARMRAAWRREG